MKEKYRVYKIFDHREIEIAVLEYVEDAIKIVNRMLRENAEERARNPNHPIALYSYRRINQHEQP